MEDNPSKYVKLKKENIKDQPDTEAGELSQPVEVPVLHVLKCPDCNQPLPLEYSPPQDEPWNSGIFACSSDQKSCLQGAFCPCVLFGKNVEALKPHINWATACLCHAVFVEGGVATAIMLGSMSGLVDPGTLFFVGELLLYAWWMCGLQTGLVREELQRRYHLKNSPCEPCCVHCFLHQCALCQEHREMKLRLPVEDSAATLDPPSTQEMKDAKAAVPSS